ncbi:MAG: ABC transporter permease [Eubacteriales bacterium]|nr:ABC transporter permease [Eubacteriales bacterium]
MKPYLESIRRLSRVGYVLLALTLVASAFISIQYCTQPYQYNVPSISKMFTPLIVLAYVSGVVFAYEGFSFLNKRSDSDFYHSLPVSRKKLFWAISLAALTWIAAIVLSSVLFTVIIFTLTRTPFVQLYALVAVPFFTIAAMLVFSACAIAMTLTGTALTGLGLTVLVFGLARFVQFSVARGIVSNTQLVNWLDLPWYLTPVTNIATGQIAQLLRPMLRDTLYLPVNMIYSAILAVLELILARVLFTRRASELAEHGAKNAVMQTVFACAAVIPVVMLYSSGIITQRNVSIPIIIAVAAGIYIIYQIVVLRVAKKVLLSIPWMLIPLAIGVAGYFGTRGLATNLQYYVPNSQDVAYVQFDGASRGSESITYQQYMVSKVRFTESDVRNYAVETLRDNVSTIRRSGFLNYSSDDQTGWTRVTQPVTFVLKNGSSFSRVLTFLNQNTLLTYCLENGDFYQAIRSLPPMESVCYLQGDDPFNGGYLENKQILNTYYQELPTTDFAANDSYRYYDPTTNYNVNDDQLYGSLSVAGYVGMTRYWDYYNIRISMPKTSSAWMAFQNNRSKGEYLELMKQMIQKSAALTSNMDYFSLSMMFYNVPMSDGSKQAISFYYNRSYGDYMAELNEQLQPLMNELADIMLRSTPTTNPSDFCAYTNWSGRVHKDDGTYYGEDILASLPATNSDGTFVSGGSVYYVSDGSIQYSGPSGAITSYNPSYRAFSKADQARLIEILQQWKTLQEEYDSSVYGSKPIDGPAIGIQDNMALPSPAPVG